MAVPTITTASPATGPASGQNLVNITGTNFRTAGYLAGQVPVQVSVGGRISEKAEVISATLIRFRVPRYLGSAEDALFTAVDIIVTNLDDDGVAVVGETVTSAAAYTYQRPGLRLPAKEPPLMSVTRAFVSLLMREITRNSAMTTHTDYGDAGAVIALPSDQPAVGMRVELERDTEYNQWDNVRERQSDGAGGWHVYRPAKAWLAIFDLTLSAPFEAEAWRMVDALIDMIDACPYLEVSADSDWDTTGVNEYPLEMISEPKQISTPNDANITAFMASLRVRGIRILHGSPVDTAYTPTTITITMSKMSHPGL